MVENEDDKGNSIKDFKEFFSTPERPVSNGELMEFWKSLSDEEKAEFKAADLSE